MAEPGTWTVGLVAGEQSGDLLGGGLMRALTAASPRPLRFVGVGGDAMAAEGLASLVPIGEVAVMGPLAIARRLPHLVRTVYRIIDSLVAARPDILVIIDSPEFTHPIARRVRRRLAGVPIIDYVSPSVWAWRPWRARKMARYVDHVLALLPFEPDVHARLGGPPCTYVGHPLVEKLDWIGTLEPTRLRDRLAIAPGAPVLAVLPGSRMSEVRRLAPVFGEALALLRDMWGADFEVVVPTVPSVEAAVRRAASAWPGRINFVTGEPDKFAAFRLARAALAASGTVTLELALSGTPMVVAYKVDFVIAMSRRLISAPSAVLANLILGENVFPEFLQEACRPEALARALAPLCNDGPERQRQLAGLNRTLERLEFDGSRPSEAAAAVVLAYLNDSGPSRVGARSAPAAKSSYTGLQSHAGLGCVQAPRRLRASMALARISPHGGCIG